MLVEYGYGLTTLPKRPTRQYGLGYAAFPADGNTSTEYTEIGFTNGSPSGVCGVLV